MFCSHNVMLEDGKVFANGGRNDFDSPYTTVFDYVTNQWVPLNNMNHGRWYPTSVALADGSVYTAIGSGGGNTSEIYRPQTGAWNLLSGINYGPMVLNYLSTNYNERHWSPLFALAPNGKIFHAGPTPRMHFIDPTGVGSASAVGNEFTEWYTKDSAFVMYDEGKLISAGGWRSGTDLYSTNKVMTIDISGPTPAVQVAEPMLSPRRFHNGVMLPNGELLVVGGNMAGEKFSDRLSILPVEIWNPATGQWRSGASMSVPRNYHSVALLLRDATVFSGGGGLCGCSADHLNGQVYKPFYLFNPDGTAAVRPVIASAPASIRPGNVFEIETNSDISRFSMIKMSATTHSINTDLRYLNVPFSGSAGTYELEANSNANVLTPGYWMLFALNAQGTPSVAAVIQVRKPNVGDPPAQSTADLDFASFADLSAFQLNGGAGGLGAQLRLASGTNAAGSAFYRTPFTLGFDSSFAANFVFDVSGVADGADGLAFVLQGNSSTALGAPGDGLGYEGIGRSLVVELDTDDDGANDINGNHVAVSINGSLTTQLASAQVPFDLENGNAHRIWITYDGLDDTLSVFVAELATDERPETALLTVPNIDLPAIIGSQGYFGFTAGTGVVTNNHDIQSWQLVLGAGGEPLAIDPIITTPQASGGQISFSASATGTGLEYRWSFGDGSPQTPWGNSPNVTHAYPGPGRYFVTLTIRDVNGNEESITFSQVVYPAIDHATATGFIKHPVRSGNSFAARVDCKSRQRHAHRDRCHK